MTQVVLGEALRWQLCKRGNICSATIKTQWTIVSFEKTPENWLNDESSLVFALYLWNEGR